jgi:amidase
MSSHITDWSALELSQHIHARTVSCAQVMQAYLERVERLNPIYNSIVSIAPREALMAQAYEQINT